MAIHGEGNIVRLVSCASGQSLRIRNGNVEGNGGQGDFAKFIVHKKGAHVMLQSWKESHYVAIKQGGLTTGSGGPWCEFKVQSSNSNPGSAICLESVKLPGQHVGVLPSGDTKAPSNTGRGPHGSFTVELLQAAARQGHHHPPPVHHHPPPVHHHPPPVHRYPPPAHQPLPIQYPPPSQPHYPPPSQPHYPPPSQPYYPPPSQPHYPPPSQPHYPSSYGNPRDLLKHGYVIRLFCASTNKYLRMHDNCTINGEGGEGQLSRFVVITRGPELVSFQWDKNMDHYLGIQNGRFFVGCGGQYCIFKVQTSSHNPSYLSFESLFHPNQFMGILPTGEPKLASQTGRGPHGSFSPVFVEQKVMQPNYNLRSSSAYWMLAHGNVVFLTSQSCGKNLRINPNGNLDCQGEWGDFAKWIVEVRGEGYICLKSFKNPANYLMIRNQATCVGSGGDYYCEFRPVDPSDGHLPPDVICFQARKAPSQHVGVLPSSAIKPPNQTGRGQHGQFTVRVSETIPAYQ